MINVQLFQFNVALGDFEKNKNKIMQLFSEELLKTTSIVVLPEMWNNGYDLENLNEKADDNLKVTINFISNLAKEYKVSIVTGSVSNKKQDEVYNTLVVFNENGELIYNYDKIHLVPMLDEPKFMVGGHFLPQPFQLMDTDMGGIICYDLRFPESTRQLAVNGAKVIFVVAEWPDSRLYHWKHLNIARAIENAVYVIACNSSGSDGKTTYAGHSMIVDPRGNVIQEAGESESTIFTEIDVELVHEIRESIPVFKNRRIDLYS